MGILKALFLITLITFPLGQVARLQLWNNISITLFDISVLLTGVWWLFAVMRKSVYTKGHLVKPILFFSLTIIISLVANSVRYAGNELFVASLYGLRWFLFACMYFVLSDLPTDFKKRIRDLLPIVGGVVLVIGYLQYFFYANLRNLYYLGWDEHLARMFSSFLDPNFYGAFLVLYLIFLLGRIVERKDVQQHLMYSSLAVFTFIGIFLTTSRSALIMLTVSLVTFLILIKKTKLILVFVAITAGIFLLASPFFYIENINPFRVASSLARVESAQNALTIFSQNSMLGVGFNAYRYAQYEYGFREPTYTYPNHADGGTDTSLLFVFATTGILGGLSYCYLLSRILLVGKRSDSSYRMVLIASMVGLLVDSLFINSLFYPLLMYWIWVLAGLTDYT